MPTPDLVVDLDALDELARQLRALRSDLEEAGGARAAAGGLGSDPLDDAVVRFVDRWRGGRGRIADQLDGLIGRLEGATGAYRDNERRLAGATR